MGPEFLIRGPNISLGSTLGLVPTTNMKMNSLRSRRLEVVGERKNERARGRHAYSVSVWSRRNERGTRVKHRAKNSASNPNHPPPPPVSFFGSRPMSCAAKTESLVPRPFFAPKPNGNACYAGYFRVNWDCYWGQRKKWPIADQCVSLR